MKETNKMSNEYKLKLYILKAIRLGILYGSSNKKEIYENIIQNELLKIPLENNKRDEYNNNQIIILDLEKRKNTILHLIRVNLYSGNTFILDKLKMDFIHVMKEIERYEKNSL